MTDSSKKVDIKRHAHGHGLLESTVAEPTDAAPSADIPVPEAIETNDDEVWALWEDSVAFQDSQFPDDSHGIAVKGEPDAPPATQDTDADVFATVTKHAG